MQQVGAPAGHEPLGVVLGLWTVLPFAVLRACIALLPLAAPRW
jgi:hypothetical protein